MSNLNSLNISVFPSSRRANVQISARLMTEEAIARFTNKLVDVDGFIITSEDDYAEASPFEFNIHGYYFYVEKASYILNLSGMSSATNIYAKITLDIGNDAYELQGTDSDMSDLSNSTYSGVDFVTSEPTASTSVHYLHLFTRTSTSDSWTVVSASRIKFTNLQIDVDGGEI